MSKKKTANAIAEALADMSKKKTANAIAEALAEVLPVALAGEAQRHAQATREAATEAVAAAAAADTSDDRALANANDADSHSDSAQESANEASASATEAEGFAEHAESQCDGARDAAAEALGEAQDSRILAVGFLGVIDTFYKVVAGDLEALTELKDRSARTARIVRLLTGEFACAEADADALELLAVAAEAEADRLKKVADETATEAEAVGDTTEGGEAGVAMVSARAADTARDKATELRAKANAAYEAAEVADRDHDPERARKAAQAVADGGEFEPVPVRPEYPSAKAEPSPEPAREVAPESALAKPEIVPGFYSDDPKAEGGE